MILWKPKSCRYVATSGYSTLLTSIVMEHLAQSIIFLVHRIHPDQAWDTLKNEILYLVS